MPLPQLSNFVVFVVLGFLVVALEAKLLRLLGLVRLSVLIGREKDFYSSFRAGIVVSLAIALAYGFYRYGVGEVVAQVLAVLAGFLLFSGVAFLAVGVRGIIKKK
ncbi:hypothetical protein [uncultured Aquitalea sp.]|uniref:hypothetical protein n=1 Tax=uncultured Aquitalea sp. TaxID=540272 RepID=UPI0025DB01C7|nr:hypothetical protein [uncultured Aquitalea sp.]